jgi:DNA repair exonuclease SbcCD ATPase subunit
MIVFKQISYRNFLSSGNQPTQIKFTDTQTALIVGANGSGKSTMLDALCFSLFNKAFRKITKGQLVNSTNEKECLVEIEFSIGTREYKVVRGIKPNIFQIWIDGVLQNQAAASTDQQKQLEDNILKLNYKSFTQIVILGSASFVPFMQLSTAHRREVVEDLLDIKIFSAMNAVIKDRIKNTNDKIKELSLKQSMTEEKVEMQKEFIESIERSGKENIEKKKDKITSITTYIDQLTAENGQKVSVVSETLQPQLEDLLDASKKLKKLSNLKGKISEKVSSITEQHKFFNNNSVCPTCTQTIEEEFRLNKVSESETKAKELQQGYNELKEAIQQEEKREREFNVVSKEINFLNNEISNNNVKISQLNKQSRDLGQEIQDIANKIKNRNVEREVLTELEQSLNLIEIEKANEKENITYYDFANFLMKDGGIKSKIIKQYLPLMNKQINKYLQMMDFYINFTLDEEFKENIKSPIHEDFTYESFSEGEKMRINLAILFTWREIARMKNSVNTNLLILDEVFDSSLDFMGTDYFTRIIKYVIKDTNIFVISHKTDELIDKFDRVIKFEKIKGFSKMVD